MKQTKQTTASHKVKPQNNQSSIEQVKEDESLTAAAGASENLVEATNDPYENLTDSDFKKKK